MDATIENKKRVPLKENKIFRWIIIPLCIALCFVVRFFPDSWFPMCEMAVGMDTVSISKDGLSVIFIFIGCLIMWLTIGIDWPSLVCILALGFLDNFGFKQVFQNSFGNETFPFLLFTFICTYALSKTSFIKRVSLAFVNNKFAKNHGFWFIVLFLFAVLLLGLVMSPSVLFVAILPILNEIFAIAKINKGDKVGKVMMMGLGFTVSISSGMTTIAHIFPVYAINNAHVSVTPLQYMLVGIPAGLALFGIMCLLFAVVLHFGKDCDCITNVDTSEIVNKLEPITLKDILTLSIFGVVVLLWIVPSFFKEGAPDFYNAINKYGTAMPPLLGTVALCVIRVKEPIAGTENQTEDGKPQTKSVPLVNLVDALKNGIPWPGMIMCAATLVLGVVLTNDAVGLKAFLSGSMQSSIASWPLIALLIIFALWAALQTNVSSNMVTATLVATVAGLVLNAAGIDQRILASLACVIGMIASYAFATPPSMPHIAIVAGSGYASTKDVLIYGGVLMIASIATSLLIAYPIGLAIF